MDIFKVLTDVEAATGTKAKKQVLVDAVKNDKTETSRELKYVLKQALDPFITFGVKKFELGEPCDHGQGFLYKWDETKLVLNNLQSRKLTGNAALDMIKRVTAGLDTGQQAVFTKIIQKDLKCGLGAKSINDAFPGLIRTFDVQLAQPTKHGKINYPCLVEQKLDGIRCLAFVVGGVVRYYSRNGIELENFGIFTKDLLILAAGNNLVFDGEVIGASLDESFVGVTKQFKRKKDVNADTLKYHLFDVLSYDEFLKKECASPQSNRTVALGEMFNEYYDNEEATLCIQKVCGVMATSEKSLMRFYEKCLAKGYEGVVAKNLEAMYTYKRDASWTKVKPVETLDLEIIGIEEGKGKYGGMLGAFIVDHNGVNVHVGSGFSDKQRREWFTKDMIGKIAEIKYDCETPDGSLRFPRMKNLRPDKGE